MIKRLGGILAVILVLGMLCGCSTNTAKVTEAVMCTSIDDQGKNADTVTVFPANADQLTVSAYVEEVSEETNAYFVWYYETMDMKLASFEVEPFNEPQYLMSYLTIDADLWPTGQYRVDVYVDSRSKPDLSIHFQVAEPDRFQVDNAVMCNALNDDNSNYDIVNSFTAQAAQICTSVHVSGIGAQDIPVTFVWMNLDTDEVIYSQDLTIPTGSGTSAYIGSRISREEAPWEPGQYGVGLKQAGIEDYLVFLNFDITE